MHPEAIAGKRTFRRFQAKYIKKGAGYAIKGQLEFSFLRVFWNSVIRKIREIPPWEWGGEFLELEPQVLRFLDTFAKRYPECAAFKTAYTHASALAVYRRNSRKAPPLQPSCNRTAAPTNRRINHHKTADSKTIPARFYLTNRMGDG